MADRVDVYTIYRGTQTIGLVGRCACKVLAMNELI